MKKFYLLMAFLSFVSCSTDNDVILSERENQVGLNAVVNVNGCAPDSFSIGNFGHIEVTNDQYNLYVSIVAADYYRLVETKLHVVNSEDSFPTVGKGNLPPGRMEYKLNFDPSMALHTFTIPLEDFEGCLYLASQSEFSGAGGKTTLWAGDITGPSGGWSYFEYCLQNCNPSDPPCDLNAGPDNLITLHYSDAAAIESWDEVRKLYLNLLGTGIDRTGTFSPSIWDIINDFNERGLGDYTTEYTIGEGDCTDSVLLTVRVVADANDPDCELLAGSDKLITMPYSEAASIESWDEVRKLYLNLLDVGVSTSGTFNPSIWDIINDFNIRGVGDYTTEYTVVEGDCSDTALLTVRVVQD